MRSGSMRRTVASGGCHLVDFTAVADPPRRSGKRDAASAPEDKAHSAFPHSARTAANPKWGGSITGNAQCTTSSTLFPRSVL
jgi:hypothetical protein